MSKIFMNLEFFFESNTENLQQRWAISLVVPSSPGFGGPPYSLDFLTGLKAASTTA